MESSRKSVWNCQDKTNLKQSYKLVSAPFYSRDFSQLVAQLFIECRIGTTQSLVKKEMSRNFSINFDIT